MIENLFRSSYFRKRLHKAVDYIRSRYPETALLHGDLHPGNIIELNNKWYWIDLGLACKGPAILDIGTLYIMLCFSDLVK